MKELFYLKNTLLNMEYWLDGFIGLLLEYCDCDSPVQCHQIITLYNNQISEIIVHAKNLVKDIEESEFNET